MSHSENTRKKLFCSRAEWSKETTILVGCTLRPHSQDQMKKQGQFLNKLAFIKKKNVSSCVSELIFLLTHEFTFT